MHPVQLIGQQVALREFEPDDRDGLAAIVGSPEVTYWLSFDQRNEAETAEMLTGILDRAKHKPRSEYYLAISRSTTDNVIGLCRLALGGVKAAKLGFAVRADLWGQGVATDATATMVNFAFTTLELHRVTAAIGPSNEASIAIAKKLGFSYEGRLRDHVFTNGRWRDSLLYSILGPEWPTAHPANQADHT